MSRDMDYEDEVTMDGVDMAWLAESLQGSELLPESASCAQGLPGPSASFSSAPFGQGLHPGHLPGANPLPVANALSMMAQSGADHLSTCWGALVKGDVSRCDPTFVPGRVHFKTKFCSHCIDDGLRLPAERVCVLTDELAQVITNNRGGGFWKHDCPAAGTDDEFRVINNTAECTGPRLVCYRSSRAPPLAWGVLPEQWQKDGMVLLMVAKGTLVPESTLVNARSRTSSKRPRGEGAAAGALSKPVAPAPLQMTPPQMCEDDARLPPHLSKKSCSALSCTSSTAGSSSRDSLQASPSALLDMEVHSDLDLGGGGGPGLPERLAFLQTQMIDVLVLALTASQPAGQPAASPPPADLPSQAATTPAAAAALGMTSSVDFAPARLHWLQEQLRWSLCAREDAMRWAGRDDAPLPDSLLARVGKLLAPAAAEESATEAGSDESFLSGVMEETSEWWRPTPADAPACQGLVPGMGHLPGVMEESASMRMEESGRDEDQHGLEHEGGSRGPGPDPASPSEAPLGKDRPILHKLAHSATTVPRKIKHFSNKCGERMSDSAMLHKPSRIRALEDGMRRMFREHIGGTEGPAGASRAASTCGEEQSADGDLREPGAPPDSPRRAPGLKLSGRWRSK